jgi:hypothetical protein
MAVDDGEVDGVELRGKRNVIKKTGTDPPHALGSAPRLKRSSTTFSCPEVDASCSKVGLSRPGDNLGNLKKANVLA